MPSDVLSAIVSTVARTNLRLRQGCAVSAYDHRDCLTGSDEISTLQFAADRQDMIEEITPCQRRIGESDSDRLAEQGRERARLREDESPAA